MLVFIHNNFKLDITYLQVTFTERNQWFKDDFNSEFTFPFDFYLDTALTRDSGFDAHYNAENSTTIFSGVLDIDGIFVNADLVFQSVKGKKISSIIKAGTNDFPSFDKNLSNLNLEQKIVPDIIEEAKRVIKLGYPATNYNFPMIHTDKYDAKSTEWNGFEGTINNYRDSDFVRNILEPETNLDVIKNIMQPLPYLNHIVKTGIEDAGFTLEGDILTDPNFTQALVFRDGSYFVKASNTEIPFIFQNFEWDALAYVKNKIQHVSFDKEVTIDKKGDYIVFGSICNARYKTKQFGQEFNLTDIKIIIYKNDEIIFTSIDNGNTRGYNVEDSWYDTSTQDIDINITLEIGDKIRIEKTELQRNLVPSVTPDYPEAISLKIVPIRFRYPDGSPIISTLNLNEIDLKKVVPDLSFREVIEILKNWNNYEFTSSGSVINMNRIIGQINRENAIDLEEFEEENPEIQLHGDREFELSFTDGKANSKYQYDSVFVSKNGFILNSTSKKESVNKIIINALPLPLLSRNGANTAHSFEDDNSKFRLVYMNPVLEGIAPVTFQNNRVLLPNMYQTDFKEWLEYRIKSNSYSSEFIISVEKFKDIKIQSVVFWYKNYHLLTDLEKERLNLHWWRITAKSESLL